MGLFRVVVYLIDERLSMSVPGSDWFFKSLDYYLSYYNRPKLDIQVVPNLVGNNSQSLPAPSGELWFWEFYFRVRNVGKSQAHKCIARLKLPEFPIEYKSQISPLFEDAIHEARNPTLNWIEPGLGGLMGTSQNVKKLDKLIDLPPDPERRYYVGTIQVYRVEDGTGNAQVLLTDQKNNLSVVSMGLNSNVKIHNLTLNLNYLSKETLRRESRHYILDTRSIMDVTLKEDLVP
jgi:hypothetical protein